MLLKVEVGVMGGAWWWCANPGDGGGWGLLMGKSSWCWPSDSGRVLVARWISCSGAS